MNNTINNQPSYTNQTPNTVQDFIRKHRALSLILAVGIIALVIVFLIWLYLKDNNPTQTAVTEAAPIPYLEHYYLVEYSVDQQTSSQLQTQLSDVIVNPEEIASAPSANTNDLPNFYTATLNEDSFQDSSTLANTLIYIDISVSDGRIYKLTLYSDYLQQNYIAVALDRTDNQDIADHVFIYSADQSAEEFATSWAKTLNLTTPIITNNQLY